MVKTRKTMAKQLIKEAYRMQQLAGLINESQLNEVNDDDKALGILFHPSEDEDEYEWDTIAYSNLVKSMGYEDYEDVAGEMTYNIDPAGEEEMRIFRKNLGYPNLKPKDLTIGMYKQAIEKEFPL